MLIVFLCFQGMEIKNRHLSHLAKHKNTLRKVLRIYSPEVKEILHRLGKKTFKLTALSLALLKCDTRRQAIEWWGLL